MISVAIPTFERPGHLRRAVNSILEGSKLPDEIIVVDQSGGEETRLAVASLGSELVRYERCARPSTSGARNRGAELAGSEYVAFVDDDCEMPPSWLHDVELELERFRYPDALYGAMRNPLTEPDKNGIPVAIFVPDRAREWSFPADPAGLGYSGHMVVRRQGLLELGGFDDRLGPGSRLFAAEDMDLNYRMLKAGHRVVSSPGIWVVHNQWRSQDELPRHAYRQNVGQGAFCAKHVRGGDRYPWRLFRHQVYCDVRMLASAARRRSWLRARAAAWRSAGTWTGLARGWRHFRTERT